MKNTHVNGILDDFLAPLNELSEHVYSYFLAFGSHLDELREAFLKLLFSKLLQLRSRLI